MSVVQSIRIVACFVLCLALLGPEIEAKPAPAKDTKCGYQNCNKALPNALNVHLVPHSHDDVGWLKTVDQYFFGTKTNYQRADVNAIITSVVKALKENPERRFIQVETAFFYRWWQMQNEDTKQDVHKLVENGQLEFTGGAWSMNDEAAVHYQSIVDQFTFGLKFLNDTLGECARPKIGWQIDPFGHTSEMASIFAQMGYDGLFFARLDWRDKMARLKSGRADMIWQGSKKLGNASNLFTSVLYNHYSAPPGFCFDALCSEDAIVTDIKSTEYNFRPKVETFKEFISKQSAHYKTNNIIITMGDDFHYQDAMSYYRNMDTLIEGFSVWPQYVRDQKVNVFYSSPACYVKAVNDAVNANKFKLPMETYDFLPYASDYHAYWSGYYTSRPASKRSEKSANNLLQIHKQLAAFTQTNNASEFFAMQDAVGIMQHHDAITGTEKQHVANDYARIMHEAFVDSGTKINGHISKLLSKDGYPVNINLKQCLMRNATICVESNSDEFIVVVYNPLSAHTVYPVRIPVKSLDFEILGPDGDSHIKYQVSPSIAYNAKLRDGSQYELTFIARMKPFGLKLFRVKKTSADTNSMQEDVSRRKYKLGNARTGFSINPSTGLVDTVTINGNEMKMRQELMYYLSAQGDNSVFDKRASGAYIFRNLKDTVAQQFTTEAINVTTYKGDVYDEVQQVFSSWAKQTIRVYHDDMVGDNIEFEWYVGSIPVGDNRGKEVISRFTSALESAEDFYTDSNGREMIHRIRDYRPTYNYSKEEPIAGNYYPVTTQMTITNGNVRVTLLNDRAQGGSSLQSGQMELMVHRRMLNDDAFGVGEALNERDDHGEGLKVRGRHYLTITTPTSEIVVRRLANKISLEPWIFIDDTTNQNDIATINHEFSGFHQLTGISEVVKMFTLEPIPGESNTLLLRLENFFDSDEKKQVTIDLKDLFEKFEIVSLQETNLAGNMLKSNVDRLAWYQYSTESDTLTNSKKHYDNLQVTLNPMEIKTFIARVNYK